MRKARARPTAAPDAAADDAEDAVVQTDLWTEPLTGSECVASTDQHVSAADRISWLAQPAVSSGTVVIGLWARRAIMADPRVQEWQRDHAAAILARSRTGQAPTTADALAAVIADEFEAEGGKAAIATLTVEVASAFEADTAGRAPARTVTYALPDGTRIEAVTTEAIARSPVVTLTYPADDATASLAVLRDAPLGALCTLADDLAQRYLVPASEIVFCVLTGQPPRVSPIRLGLRFRRFTVDGVPMSATSRVVLDVDPQIAPAELARTFAQWQRASQVHTSASNPKLVSLAAQLVGRLRLVPAEENAESATHPTERMLIGHRSWWLLPSQPWLALAREIKYDPHLIRTRATTVIALLVPLDAPRAPRWLPRSAP